MSNDLKFWAMRLIIAIILLFDLYLLGKVQTTAASGEGGKWFGALLISILVSIPVFLYYYFMKARRWGSSGDAKKIEVETLAKAAQNQREEKQKGKR